jgi:ketosteroid isomerase-like protein
MDVAASGDFGISTGPWEMQEFRPNSISLGTGYFLTVWKKNPNGIWKVILDDGSSTPPVLGKAHLFSFPEGADKPVANVKLFDQEKVLAELKEVERQMLSAWKANPVSSTYSSFLSRTSRIQLEGRLPSVNRDSINIWLSERDKTLTWNIAGGGAASSGDLGFTYGYMYLKGITEKPSGHYVRIWKKQPGGKWAITIEMMSMN